MTIAAAAAPVSRSNVGPEKRRVLLLQSHTKLLKDHYQQVHETNVETQLRGVHAISYPTLWSVCERVFESQSTVHHRLTVYTEAKSDLYIRIQRGWLSKTRMVAGLEIFCFPKWAPGDSSSCVVGFGERALIVGW